ncbi:MarR family transcriptional regulator, partial [Vibrio parahaemolyticus]
LTEEVAEKMSLEQIVYKDISDQMMLKLNEQEAKQLQSLLNKALGN